MLIRLLFLLLLALNLGAAAWLLFGRVPVSPPPPVTDPGVPELRLLTEPAHPKRSSAPAPAASVVPAAAATAAAAVQRARVVQPGADPEWCATLGPFTSLADMRAAFEALSPHVARIQYREAPVALGPSCGYLAGARNGFPDSR